jgi:hypothetical protein
MKLAGLTPAPGTLKGHFGPEDGDHLILDLTQGPHGRAFCGSQHYDLPDPRAQLVTVENQLATLEIISRHGAPVPMGRVEVAILKITGDIQLPVVRAKRFDLLHSWLEANEVSGPRSEFQTDPQTIQEILMRDSHLKCRGEINFHNVAADDEFDSFLAADYLEGITVQGRISIAATHLMVALVEAQEVQVAHPDGCHVAQIFCSRVLLKSERPAPVHPVYDRDLVEFMNNLQPLETPQVPAVSRMEHPDF